MFSVKMCSCSNFAFAMDVQDILINNNMQTLQRRVLHRERICFDDRIIVSDIKHFRTWVSFCTNLITARFLQKCLA